MIPPDNNDRGLFDILVDDGRPLLSLTAVALIGSGLFAFFLSATKHFLPHDVDYLGMTPPELCAVNECRIVHFMIHDRVSFGGSLVAVGTLYLWLAAAPLRQGEAWAWWLFVVSGLLGFASFLLYLGYGYLDTWHGAATLVLLPCFMLGLAKSYRHVQRPAAIGSLLRPGERVTTASRYGIGRLFLLTTAFCLFVGGSIIATVGVTTIFVPQDLQYMGLTVERLTEVNPRLPSLIAHDRAGFGGGVACCGLTMFFCIWCGQASRSRWQALFVTGVSGFATAIGVHPAIGYNDLVHLAPAMIGAALFTIGIALTFPGSQA
ncbi:MAG TPA: hypothetical protein VJ783_07185 [Pirellulales bacterium]|nr:hypothetical protein [Pirellulales bacterium]